MSGGEEEKRRRHSRNTAEWVLFGLCLAVVTGVAALVVWLWLSGTEAPPRFTVTAGASQSSSGGETVFPVEVRNTGTRTAANVVVVARDRDGETLVSQTIDYISGGEKATVTFVLPRSPGSATFDVAAFQEP